MMNRKKNIVDLFKDNSPKKAKKEGSGLKKMSMDEAGKIVRRAKDEDGENWSDSWNAIDDDLRFVTSSLEVIGDYALENEETCLCPLIDDLRMRTMRVQEELNKVIKRLAEKHRFGPHLPRGKEDNYIFTVPKVVLEKYKLT